MTELEQPTVIDEQTHAGSYFEWLQQQREHLQKTGEFFSDAEIVDVMTPEYQAQLEEMVARTATSHGSNKFMEVSMKLHPDLTVEPESATVRDDPGTYDYQTYDTLLLLAAMVARDAMQDDPELTWPMGCSIKIAQYEIGDGEYHDAETPHIDAPDAGELASKHYIASIGAATRVWRGGPFIPEELGDIYDQGHQQTRRVMKIVKAVGAEEIPTQSGAIVAFNPALTLHAAPGGQKQYAGIIRTTFSINVYNATDTESLMQSAPSQE